MHRHISCFVLVFLWLAFLPSSPPLIPLPLNLVLEERKACTACSKSRVRTKVRPRRWRVSSTAVGTQCQERVPGRETGLQALWTRLWRGQGPEDRLYRLRLEPLPDDDDEGRVEEGRVGVVVNGGA